MESAALYCPAKVNLYLEVHSRRPDGYHDLGSLFQTLALGDTLSAEPAEAFSMTGAEEVTPDAETNLVLRAARLLLAEAAKDPALPPPKFPALRFHLDKKLPAGAGLGGGSSNAAAAFLLANRILGMDMPLKRLSDLAARLGSDIPFFLHGGTAFVQGKGEVVASAPAPYPFKVVIATPKVSVATAWAYQNLESQRKRQWDKFKALYHIHCEDPGFFRVLHNDFEAPMIRHFPEIAEVYTLLARENPVKVLLSGSGASLFALFTDLPAAQSAQNAVASKTRFQALTEFLD